MFVLLWDIRRMDVLYTSAARSTSTSATVLPCQIRQFSPVESDRCHSFADGQRIRVLVIVDQERHHAEDVLSRMFDKFFNPLYTFTAFSVSLNIIQLVTLSQRPALRLSPPQRVLQTGIWECWRIVPSTDEHCRSLLLL